MKFFTTFGSILRLQLTVTFGSVLGLQVNSEFQLPKRWGAVCYRYNAASPWANQRKSRTDNPQHNSNWD